MTETPTKPTSRKARSQAKKAAAPVTEQGPSEAMQPAETKIGIVTRLLRQHGGASLDDLVGATGWQSHTTRAALTGLRKKGHAVVKDRVDGVTRYLIATAGPEA